MLLLACTSPHRPRCGSSRFCPPVCYQLSQAGTSSLLRSLLPPHTASLNLESPLGPPYPYQLIPVGTIQGFPKLLRVPCEPLHPQSRHGSDQVLGFTPFCTLTLPCCRIRFTFAVCRSLPIASFRPCRCQQRPCDLDCLPPDRGDVPPCGTGFARSAGQTKKGRGKFPTPFLTKLSLFCRLLFAMAACTEI